MGEPPVSVIPLFLAAGLRGPSSVAKVNYIPGQAERNFVKRLGFVSPDLVSIFLPVAVKGFGTSRVKGCLGLMCVIFEGSAYFLCLGEW